MNTSEHRSRLRTFAVPGLLAALCFAPATSAQSNPPVAHTYSGSECEPGAYNLSKNTIAINGAMGAKPGANDFLGALCPIIRTKPTYSRVDVLVYLMDLDSGTEENAATTVNCSITTTDQHGNTSSADDPNNVSNAAKTMTGVFRHSPMSLSYKAVATSAQPFWTAIISTEARWRRTHLFCNGLPPRTAVRSYLVTELP